MGGERETVAIQTKVGKSGEVLQCGRVRYHEETGEVHFHDDENGLKVSITSGVWFSMYQTLMGHVPNHMSFPDAKNKAVLHVSTRFKKAKRKRTARIDLDMSLEPIDTNEQLAALQRFTVG